MYTVNSFTPVAAEVNIACCMTVCSWSDNGFFTECRLAIADFYTQQIDLPVGSAYAI